MDMIINRELLISMRNISTQRRAIWIKNSSRLIVEPSLFEDVNDGWKYTVGPELEHDISTDGPVLSTGRVISSSSCHGS